MPGPLAAVTALTRRELRARLGGPWLYVLVSAVAIASILFGGAFVRSFETETVVVSSGPLEAFNAGVLLILGLVFGIRLAASLATEREHRTLEVLLAAPVGHVDVVTAKFLAEVAAVATVLLAYAAFLGVGQPLGPGVLDLHEASAILRLSVFLLPVMGFALLVSACWSSVRGAVVTFVLLFGLLAALEIAALALAPLAPADVSLSVLAIRSAVERMDGVLGPLSPVSHLLQPVRIHLGRGVEGVGAAAGAVALAAGMLALAVLVSRRKGVA